MAECVPFFSIAISHIYVIWNLVSFTNRRARPQPTQLLKCVKLRLLIKRLTDARCPHPHTPEPTKQGPKSTPARGRTKSAAPPPAIAQAAATRLAYMPRNPTAHTRHTLTYHDARAVPWSTAARAHSLALHLKPFAIALLQLLFLSSCPFAFPPK